MRPRLHLIPFAVAAAAAAASAAVPPEPQSRGGGMADLGTPWEPLR